MNIAFCVNRLALIGLGPTISSLVRNCSDSKQLNIYILTAFLNKKDKQNIEELLVYENFKGNFKTIDIDPKEEFGTFRSLHGDWTTYGRLLLPELIIEDRILYLDSDLIIEVDVLEAAHVAMGNSPIAAVKGGHLKHTLDNFFYLQKLKLPENLYSFNAGVLLFNLTEWRKQNVKAKCIELAKQYPMDLLSCDQSLLNALFAGNFPTMPASFNCVWYANKPKPDVAEKMILHFVGSPKPWDPMAYLIHKGYNTWKKYLTEGWEEAYGHVKWQYLRRVWQIRRSYLRNIQKKLKKVFLSK